MTGFFVLGDALSMLLKGVPPKILKKKLWMENQFHYVFLNIKFTLLQ